MTSLFTPVSIGPKRREQTFTSASIGFNNPTRELIKEAERQFGSDMRVSTILSIGSGRPALLAFDGPKPASNELLKGIVMDCERVARELSTQLFNVDTYLRLTVDRGMENTEMSDWEGLGSIEGHTATYLEIPAVTKAIDSSLQRLQDRVGSITLGQLSEFAWTALTPCLRSHRSIQWGQDAGENRSGRITLLCCTERVLGANEAASRHFSGT
jgi:hypothetical protein